MAYDAVYAHASFMAQRNTALIRYKLQCRALHKRGLLIGYAYTKACQLILADYRCSVRRWQVTTVMHHTAGYHTNPAMSYLYRPK